MPDPFDGGWAFDSTTPYDSLVPEVPYHELALSYDDQDLWTETVVSGVAGQANASDTAATATYGRRTLDITTIAASANELLDQANGLLNRYKVPALRPTSLQLIGPRELTQQLALKVGDRVTLKRRPPGGGTLTVDALIEGIDHNVGSDGWPSTTFALVPVEVTTPWLLGDATYGVLDSTTRLGW